MRRISGIWVVIVAVAGAAAPSALGAATFGAAGSFAAGTGPSSIATADFNGDGKLDLVVVNTSSGDVNVLLGNGSGSFGGRTNFAAGVNPDGVAVADFNADGMPDLAVSDEGTDFTSLGSVDVLLNTTAGGAATPSFSAATNFATGGKGVFGVAVGDVNGDSKPDFVVAEANSMDVATRLNNTAPHSSSPIFGPAVTTPSTLPGTTPELADFDGDGKADISFIAGGDQAVFVFRGNDTGAFTSGGGAGSGGITASDVIGDFNGDGKPDLAMSNHFKTSFNSVDGLGLALNTTTTPGTGPTFTAPKKFAAGTTPNGLAAADFNGDGRLDLAVANGGSNNASVLLGDGAGSLGPAANFAAGTNPQSVVAGDFNGDGAPDLAITNSGSNNISVLLNIATADPSPSALGFGSAAQPVKPGTLTGPQTVTITNNGSAPLKISGFNLGGQAPGEFITSGDTCHSAIASGGSCTVQVRFAPTVAGTRSAILTPASNAPSKPSVTLIGSAGTVTPLSPPGAPRLSGLRISPSAFVAGHTTHISYRDSEKAKTTFTVLRPTRGVRKGRRCVAAPRHVKKGAKRCTRLVVMGSFTHNDTVGVNRVRFTGRLRGKKLRPGSYRLSARARNAAGKRSRAVAKGFRIRKG